MTETFDWETFVATADRIAPEFEERTRPMTELVDSSILYSDGLCVCALCEMYEVDHLIEVGTGFGGSTEMFARYFDSHDRLKRIWSIDDAVNPRWQWLLAKLQIRHYSRHVWSTEKRASEIAGRRLETFAKVALLHGDASRRVPELLERLERERPRVGLLIDGPKGAEQLQFAEATFRQFSSVLFAALDDIGPMFDYEDRYARFAASPHAVFATSDRRFLNRYRAINGTRLPLRMLTNEQHQGYGLGVLVAAHRGGMAQDRNGASA